MSVVRHGMPPGSRMRFHCLVAVHLAVAICSFACGGCDQFARIGILDPDAGDMDSDAGGMNVDGSTADAGADANEVPVVVQLDDCGPDNQAGLSPGTISALFKGGSGETQRFLYPYEGTVFPGGLMPPLLMWEGPSSDAVLLRLRTVAFAYTGCLRPTGTGQVAIPEEAWAALQASNAGADEAVEIQLTTLDGERALGPIQRSIKVARAPLPIVITYMAYGSTRFSTLQRLRLGQPAQRLSAANDCSGCHAASAQGTRLVDYSNGGGSAQCIDASTTTNPASIVSQLPGAELGALTPDGALYVAPAHPPTFGTQTRGTALSQAALIDVVSAAMLSQHNIPAGATVPAFSPDGTRLAFNDFAIASGRGLAVMDFDLGARAAANYREVYRDSALYPAWPSFVRGTSRIVFARGVTRDFSAGGAYVRTQASPVPPASDLYSVVLDSGAAVLLARAMGFSASDATDGESYLPFAGDDLHKNYYPQVAPVTSDRYAWVFFDSIRHYGNQGSMRQIWGAALDLTSGVEDPSHPAFYLSGQDATTTNLRAVSALEPEAGSPSCTP